jgi:5'-3' exonuclease
LKQIDTSHAIECPKLYVIDGGCLLHKVKWLPSCSYRDVFQQYVRHVQSRYGSDAVIVFDGYGNGPSIKDTEHARRAAKVSADIAVDELKLAHRDQSAFLANEANKKSFVACLMQQLLASGYVVKQAFGDADTVIAATALELAEVKGPVTVVADDTDVLVLLVHHFKPQFSDIFMLSQVSKRRSGRTLVMPIRIIRSTVGDAVACQLPVIHAISGCDSTSAMFGMGKATVFRKFVNSAELLSLAEQFSKSGLHQEFVSVMGLKIVAFLYCSKASESLNHC